VEIERRAIRQLELHATVRAEAILSRRQPGTETTYPAIAAAASISVNRSVRSSVTSASTLPRSRVAHPTGTAGRIPSPRPAPTWSRAMCRDGR
jgi:hypothetical protein